MAIAVADIITTARHLLNDAYAERWPSSQLCIWIAECHGLLASTAAVTCVERGVQDIVNGPVQPLASEVLAMVQILGICNSAGVVSSALTECSDRELFLENPAWMSDTPATPIHYARATGDARKYYFYPFYEGEDTNGGEGNPDALTSYFALMDYVSMPVAAADISGETPEITSLDMFDTPALALFADYVTYRALGIDADHVANMALSTAYYQAFVGKLTAYVNALTGAPAK